ncbi:MAG TPA: putative glycoside hydrolase [Sporichthyaceae bacterium]|jgi:hypothetical protein|nr:putative glycoside hydrolase [Sporichthyaceae bacterium]
MTAFDAGPPGAGGGEPGDTPGQSGSGRKRKTGRNTAVVGGVALLLVVVGAAAAPLANGVTIKIAANKDMPDGYVNATTIKDLAFTVTSTKISGVTLMMDGKKVDGTRQGDSIVYTPSGLPDGKHTFTAAAKGRIPGINSAKSESFNLDTAPPVINIDTPASSGLKGPFTLTGRVDGAKSLTIDGKNTPMDGTGKFSVTYDKAPLGAAIVATDAAGNTATDNVNTASTMPGMRAVHMTAAAWQYPALHDPVIAMLKNHQIDTVELDVKDEDGALGYKSTVPLAQQDGSEKGTTYDVAAAVKEIHDLGGRVVGRIVAFKDPMLAKWAWANGHPSYDVQDKSGNPYHAGSYGTAAFTNLASPEVQQYNMDLAVDAAKQGFDDIMFDYIRRPEGTLGTEVYPGIGTAQPQDVIANFLGKVEPAVRAQGAYLGAAVFGISAFTAAGHGDVAQNIPAMSKNLDFISPMIYPSHWGPGEYGVPVPNSDPYAIVHRSLMDFNRQAAEGTAQIIPWLQDFTLGPPTYTAEDVDKQIQAAHDDGVNSFLLWNAFCKFHSDALPAKDMFTPDAPGTLVYSIDNPGVNSQGTTDKQKALDFLNAYLAAKTNGTPVPKSTSSTGSAATAGTGTSSTTGSSSSNGSSSGSGTGSTGSSATASPAPSTKPDESMKVTTKATATPTATP